MRKTAFGIIVLTLFLLTSCGNGDTAENVARDMVANFKEMGAILTSVTDEASAKAAVPKIDAVRAKMRDCAKRAKAAPKIDSATEAKINEMLQTGAMEAMTTVAAAKQRLMTQPELMAIIEPAMRGMENDL
jgi:hypothetical protein